MGFSEMEMVMFSFLEKIYVCLYLSYDESELWQQPSGIRPKLKFMRHGLIVYVEIIGSCVVVDFIDSHSTDKDRKIVNIWIDLGDPDVCPVFVAFFLLISIEGLKDGF